MQSNFKVGQLNTTPPKNLSHNDMHLCQAGMSQIIRVLTTRCAFKSFRLGEIAGTEAVFGKAFGKTELSDSMLHVNEAH